MRYASVCSGIEAASVAWEPLGWRASFLSEIEKFPRAVLAHRFPNVPLHGDFTTIQDGDYEPIDLLVGGTPCQSFSVAGLRGGLGDDRGNLALEYMRLAHRLRPRWLVWENVPGVLSSNQGRDFGSILGALVELGYGFAYRVLDAQYFGVPQRRRRVFLIGYLGDWRRAAAVLFERESLRGDSPPSREKGEGVAALTANGVGTCDPDDNQAQAEHLIASTGDISHCLNAGGMGRQDYETETLIAHTLRGEGFGAGKDGTGRGTPLVPVAIQERAICENPSAGPGGKGFREDGIAYTLEARIVPQAVAFALRGRDDGAQPEMHGDGDTVGSLRAAPGGSSRDYLAVGPTQSVAVAFAQNTRDEVRETAVVGALAANPGMKQTSHLRLNSAVRRLTPRECERLQGFPDDWTNVPYRGKPAADGPRYKATGNSMAVPVMRWIGQRIQIVDALP